MSSQLEINTSNSYKLMEKIKKWGQDGQIVPVIRDIDETLITKALKNIGELVSSTPELKGNTRCYSCHIQKNIKLPDGRSADIDFSINERDKSIIPIVGKFI